MQVLANIILQWQQTDFGNAPILPVALTIGDSISDQTGQPVGNIIPDPNAAVWEFRGSDVTLDALEAANVPILWSEELPNGP